MIDYSGDSISCGRASRETRPRYILFFANAINALGSPYDGVKVRSTFTILDFDQCAYPWIQSRRILLRTTQRSLADGALALLRSLSAIALSPAKAKSVM